VASAYGPSLGGDAVRAGWLAQQALVIRGRRPGGPESQVEPEPCRMLNGGWNYSKEISPIFNQLDRSFDLLERLIIIYAYGRSPE
jgi:hypothetical protein